jgi:hypothetical protein
MRCLTGKRKPAAVLACITLILAFAASTAGAELTERGGLFVRFEGGIDPNALSRTKLAPITTSVAGTVKTLSGDGLPPCGGSGST